MTAEMPPPGGPPLPGLPLPGPLPREQAPDDPVYADAPPPPMLSLPHAPMPGTNRLAIAALCCGLAGIIPIAAIVGIVLGIVALNQLHTRVQRGKGMAIAGIVLGSLWLLGWVALFVAAVATDEPARSPSGVVTQQSEAFVEDLKAGDCFSDAGRTEVDAITIVPCSAPHESQVVTIFSMPKGPWPGEAEVTDAAEKGCTDKADPLLTDRAFDDLRPSYIYPADAFAWRGGREIICTVEAPHGTTTGTALK